MNANKKELSKKQISEIKKKISKKGYLEKEEVVFFREKFDFCKSTFQRELLDKQVPFKSGNPSNVLLSFEIEVKDKKVSLDDFNSLGNWRKELFKNSKLRAEFNCKECGLFADARLAKTIKREFFPLEPICSKCISKAVSSTDECRKRNSEAQLIVQNKEEVKEKNRQAQLKRFEDPEVRKRHSEAGKRNWQNNEYREKMEKIARDKWDDPEYARKVIKNSKNGGLKGKYKGLYYDSGYELAWILKMESEGKIDKIVRANLYIAYENKKEKTSHYYPDFIFEDKYLIEVKGYGPWVDLENLSRKNKSAKNWCKEKGWKYRLIEIKDFGNHWYRIAREKHKEINGKIKEQKNKEV